MLVKLWKLAEKQLRSTFVISSNEKARATVQNIWNWCIQIELHFVHDIVKVH